ncbi:hypothetical protein GRI33_00990 [Brucella sp. BO3]|uniref:right-handed parallel beta-helix repeat-containing protein n=1 Tax=unclassified Brucella TaxID=2632610 RepID=UPI00084F9BA1|nr:MULTISPECIES: right-handed parallel beta-helix repeat-containing protein [unclassified Brucella]OEI82472.1 hypothetical protein BA060_14895 [Brucella sp. B13-0095]QMV25587.1 hypothetical protein GRI33_00990 [Brucella sp. BO3]
MTSININRLDGLSSATAWKGPARVATTANIQLSDLQIIDGVALNDGDRVLVKDQTDARYNGIYVAQTGIWRRARDFASNRDIRKGTRVVVTDGSENAGYDFEVANENPIIIGTTPLVFKRIGLGSLAPGEFGRELIKSETSDEANEKLGRFWTRLELRSSNVAPYVTKARVLGYYTTGDCRPMNFKRVASVPSHGAYETSADGAIWEFVSGPIVWVTQFGAKGDNAQDDSLNFQATVDYLKSKAGGGEIRIPGWGRVYNFQSKRPAGLTPWAFEDPNVFLSNCNDITIRGEGNPTLTNSIYPNNRAEIFLFYKSNRCRIERIKFLGNNVGLPNEINNCAIGMLSCVGMGIDRNHFTGFQGSYIASSWLFDSIISRNRFDVLGGSGIDCAFWQNVTVRDNTFKGNQMGNNGLGTQGFQHLFDTPNFGNNETGISFIGGSGRFIASPVASST